MGAANNLPLEFVDGYIRRVRVSIPWSSLLTASSYVEIAGLMLTVQAKQMQDDGQWSARGWRRGWRGGGGGGAAFEAEGEAYVWMKIEIMSDV